nr:MAG TPA: hypothetical protein [Caudoviricetes sp.]
MKKMGPRKHQRRSPPFHDFMIELLYFAQKPPGQETKRLLCWLFCFESDDDLVVFRINYFFDW